MAADALIFGAIHEVYFNVWVAMAHHVIPDILIYIFEQFIEPSAPYLGYSDLSACCLVSKQWQTFAQSVLFRHVCLAHSLQLTSFLFAITPTNPTSSPINNHRRELARAVRSIRYAMGPSTASSILRHCENLVEFQEIWSHPGPGQGPPLEVEVFRRANSAHLQYLSAHIEAMTLLDILDFVGIWKDTLRHLRLDVRMPDLKPEDGADRISPPRHEEGESLGQRELLKNRISGYTLKSFHWLEGRPETNLASLGWIEDFLWESHNMLQVFCCPNLPASILDRILARHASTLVVLYTNKRCFEVVKKYIPAMSALEELYLGGAFDEGVRTLVPFVEAGNLPRLHLLWMEEVVGVLHVRENLLDLATALHVEVLATRTRRLSIEGRRDPALAEKPTLMWGKNGAALPRLHHWLAHSRIDISRRYSPSRRPLAEPLWFRCNRE